MCAFTNNEREGRRVVVLPKNKKIATTHLLMPIKINSFVYFADSSTTSHGPIIGTIKGIRQYWKENLRPTMNSTSKHLLHCCLLFAVVLACEIFAGGIKISENSFVVVDPWAEYGTPITIVLYLLRLLTFLTLPQVLFNFCGLVFYNAFPEKVTLKGNLS